MDRNIEVMAKVKRKEIFPKDCEKTFKMGSEFAKSNEEEVFDYGY